MGLWDEEPPCFVYVPSWGSADMTPIGFRGGGLRFLALLRSFSDVGVVGTIIALPTTSPPTATAPSVLFDASSLSVSILVDGAEAETGTVSAVAAGREGAELPGDCL